MCSNFYTYVSELVFCLFGYSCSSGYEVIFIVVSVCTSLMANDFEHLSMFLFAICVSFSEKYIFEAFVQFFLSYLFIIDCTGFCTVCGLSLVAASGSYSLVAEHRHLIAVVSLLHSMGSRHVGSVVVATGLVALWRVESSWIRD